MRRGTNLTLALVALVALAGTSVAEPESAASLTATLTRTVNAARDAAEAKAKAGDPAGWRAAHAAYISALRAAIESAQTAAADGLELAPTVPMGPTTHDRMHACATLAGALQNRLTVALAIGKRAESILASPTPARLSLVFYCDPARERPASAAAASPVTTTYDKVLGVRNISAPFSLVFKDIPAQVRDSTISAQWIDGEDHPSYRIRMLTVSENWTFLRADSLALLIDGSRRFMIDGRRIGEVASGSVVESVFWTLTDEQMRAIADATTIEGMAGVWRFTVRDGMQANAKAVLEQRR